jgi:hypothetical protein
MEEYVSTQVVAMFSMCRLSDVWREFRKIGMEPAEFAPKMWALRDRDFPAMGNSAFLFKYGFEVLQPIINLKLNRPVDYPGFNELMEEALRPYILLNSYMWTKKC